MKKFIWILLLQALLAVGRAQLPMESAVQLSLAYSPLSAERDSTMFLSTASLLPQMRLSGGSIICVGDAQNNKAPWVFKHRLPPKVNGAAPVDTDLSGMLRMEVLGGSSVGSYKSPTTNAPRSAVILGRVTSTQIVRVNFSPSSNLVCQFWGNLLVDYTVMQEAGRTAASWMPGPMSLKLIGTWAPSEGAPTGSAGLTLTMTAFQRVVGTNSGGGSGSGGGGGSGFTVPANFVLVSGGNLPASSAVGAVSVPTYCIGKTEVTWGEWQSVRTWAIARGYSIREGRVLRNSMLGPAGPEKYPVDNLSVNDAVKWCNARSEMEGKTPVYTVDGAVYKTGLTIPAVNFSANGYRLPSEAEWEFAAMGGVKSKGYIYSGSNDLGTVAWYLLSTNYAQWQDHPVGTRLPNELGIFDMSGNLSELCFSGQTWQERGGFYNLPEHMCAVNYRSGPWRTTLPSFDYSDVRLGFRLVLSVAP